MAFHMEGHCFEMRVAPFGYHEFKGDSRNFMSAGYFLGYAPSCQQVMDRGSQAWRSLGCPEVGAALRPVDLAEVAIRI